ncbi:VIN3-like protein 2 [Apostasia shenzhenica]|uniref:VIN3-like protein 2 n=1 Tax=Apostasia shenzhenica TaxID=1088818 RepID=A0A2I0A780_9ASPA|nr:VIN3-like protein 2 [Apostasia shenzhenica]
MGSPFYGERLPLAISIVGFSGFLIFGAGCRSDRGMILEAKLGLGSMQDAGFIYDPSKCQNMGIKEKREFIWQLAKSPENASQKLQTWSRRDLLEILCIEIGKERKYTGLPKQKLIENLFKIVSEKKDGNHVDGTKATVLPSLIEAQNLAKRPRKNENPSRLPILENTLSPVDGIEAPKSTQVCVNVACRGTFSLDDSFCKRCSCCICYKYDDNKDPSLWLFCNSDDPTWIDSCGSSCHLECAMKDERTGILKKGQCAQLDGSYYCIHCGKVNDLLGCWRKQLTIAKDARRVDVLCNRISLSHMLLTATQIYGRLHEIVDEAKMKLESEIGPLNCLANMGRGIVNRLSVGAEVQGLCARAIEVLDTMRETTQFDQVSSVPSNIIKFDGKSSSSLVIIVDFEDHFSSLSQELVGYMIWHRKVDVFNYSEEPTGKLYKPDKRFFVEGLTPCTEYIFKVVAFSETTELGQWEVGVATNKKFDNDVITSLAAKEMSPETNSSGLSNPTSEGNGSDNTGLYADLNKVPDSYFGYREKPEVMDSDKSCVQTYSCRGISQEETPGLSGSALDEEPNSTLNIEHNQTLDVPKSDNESQPNAGNEIINASPLPATPCMLEAGSAKSSISLLFENGPPKLEWEPRSSKKNSGKCEVFSKGDGPMEGEYEYCVKMIWWLECKGHIESSFRVKFLTWFSLRATPQERRVVSVYVDTLVDDPRSLAGQLIDTFSDAIYSKRPPPALNGFCTRLWH